MINGVQKDLMPRLGTQGRSQKAEKPDDGALPSFAEKLGGKDRTVRSEKPGRESRAGEGTKNGALSTAPGREGERRDERDSKPLGRDSRGPIETETKADARPLRAKLKREEAGVLQPKSGDTPVALQTNLNLTPPTDRSISSTEPVDGGVFEAEMPSEEDGVSATPRFEKPETSSSAAQTTGLSRDPQGLAKARGAGGAADDTLITVDEFRDEQVHTRKKAITDFMETMQKEFGVPPEKIVSAFANMDEQTLQAPPEESTRAFLSSLDLKPGQKDRAAVLYKNMVRTTGEAALNEKLVGPETGVNFDVMSPRDESLRQLNQSIDDLNSAFAIRYNPQMMGGRHVGDLDPNTKAQILAERMDAQLAKIAQRRPNDQESAKGDSNFAAAPWLTGSGAAQSAQASGAATGAGASSAALASDASGATAFSSLMTASSPLSFAGQSGMGSSMSGGGGGADLGAGGAASNAGASASEVMSSAEGAKSSFAASMAAGEAKTSGKKMEAKSGAGTEATANAAADAKADAKIDAMDSNAASAFNPAPVTEKTGTGPAGMLGQRPVATAQDEQANVKELLRQAQLAIKKGGGEVKMDLKPEGVGQVRLKVSVQDGQVNVQMLTQNDEAKRLLEKGLHELKSNLAAHQLKVENVKVDVGQELQKHMDKQSDDQARQSARQFANDVMGQFRDERQAFQQGFMDNSGWKQYARQDRRAQMDPERGSSANSAAAPTSSRGRASSNASGSGRLDLVA